MKLKEIPPYLYHRLRLSSISAKHLNNRKKKDVIPVIVSHTTIPSRLSGVHLTVRSILNGDKAPKKMILWLHDDLKNKLPKSLKKLQGNTFEIRYSPYTFSHRKLMHTREQFPEEHIVTVDDDMMYPPHFLKNLYEGHLRYPTDIVCNLGRQMKFDENNKPIEYLKWPYTDKQPEDARFLMPVGVFGVWYPPHTFDERFNDVALIQKLSPKSDDLWFKTMSYLKGTTSRVLGPYKNEMVLILGTQKIALKRTNNEKDFKRVQWKQIMEYFNITP